LKKKLLVTMTLASFLIGNAVSAYSPVKLFLDGRELTSDVPPRIEDGRLLVPVRIISEALGAKVNWNEEEKTVSIEAPAEESLKMQVLRLEEALAPQDPLGAAQSWAEGVKTRNGAWQYAVMSPELRKEKYQSFVDNAWSTGTSSPWVKSYTVTEKAKLDAESYLYEVSFTYTDSTQATSVVTEIIQVKKYDSNWFVSAIQQKPDIKGEISKITVENGKTSILVVDSSAKEPYDQALVTITDETKIYQGQGTEPVNANELKEGLTVEVVFAGPGLMSYPVRVGADTIRILP